MKAACRAALAELGVEQLVCSVHDRSLPGDSADLGCGAPGSRASASFVRFLADLGFTGVMLGPPGRVSLANLSPYDGTLFSRSTLQLSWAALADAHPALVDGSLLATFVRAPSARCDYNRAFDAADQLWSALHERWDALEAAGDGAIARLSADVDAFASNQSWWLEPDAIHEALSRRFGSTDARLWPDQRAARAFKDNDVEAISDLRSRFASATRRAAREQLLLHAQHQDLRTTTHGLGLTLIGDLQAGLSHSDRWARAALLLDGYAMGAPPSRTNPEGQPWGYPVLNPALLGSADAPGPALAFLRARFERIFEDYDGVRIDHPHALVCPWVYSEEPGDPLERVRAGARLFSAAASPKHRALALFDIARPEQMNARLNLWADDLVAGLDDAQVSRFAVAFDVLVETAARAGRSTDDIVCEVLSTVPAPLARVIARHGLGRFRVTQKADVTRPDDVYLPEAAEPRDWIMPGTHDTPSIWDVCARFPRETADARLAYAVARLAPDGAGRGELARHFARSRRHLAQAELASLFTSRAKHVMVFVSDLLGEESLYNRPGVVHPDNWLLRVPPRFTTTYELRAKEFAAFDVTGALALALLASPSPDERRRRAPLALELAARALAPLPDLSARLARAHGDH